MILTREPLIEFNITNSNRRVYLSEEFTRTRTREVLLDNSSGKLSVEEYNLLDDFNEKSSKGLKHGECTFGDIEINFKNSTHIINRIYIEDNFLYGDITILNLPRWHKYKNFIHTIDSFVFRSRSLGMIEPNNTARLSSLITFDATPRSNATYQNMYGNNRNNRYILIEKNLINFL